MGERKGQNKYYPPDFDYKVHKSLAGYHGQHPLRERARKLDRGILIIRFEMPYNIWCDGCNNHIGMGVRYNAEKSKDGMYYTTPIYKFRMKCHLCDNHFEIKTDPANHDYVIISGARRKEQRWDPHENEQIVPEDRTTQKQLALNAMYKLEHGEDDRTKGKSKQSAIGQMLEHQERQKDDFAINQLARKQFREAKKFQKTEQLKDEVITKKYGLGIKLLKESSDDVRLSKLLKFSTSQGSEDKRNPTESGLIFRNKTKNSSTTSEVPRMTKRDISLHHLQQIASSEVTKKRRQAFTSSSNATTSENEIASPTVIIKKPRSDLTENIHVTDCVGSNDSKHQETDASKDPVEVTKAAPTAATEIASVASSTPTNSSALGALCSVYADSTDDEMDS